MFWILLAFVFAHNEATLICVDREYSARWAGENQSYDSEYCANVRLKHDGVIGNEK